MKTSFFLPHSAFCVALAASIIQHSSLGIAAEPPPAAPRLEFGADGSFAFLQVSDVQEKGKLAERSAAVLRAALAAAKPGLVVLTGDNVDRGANERADFVGAMEPLVAILEKFGTPFCVTFGNHDSEKRGTNHLSRQEQYDWFKARGGRLFVDHDVPELTGVGTGAVELFAPGAEKPSFRLFVADSGSTTPLGFKGGYDACHADQIAWYERVAADGVPHLWFQHIIVPDANDTGILRGARDCERGGPEIDIRGKRVRAVVADGVLGTIKEPPCPPKWSTYRDEEHTVDGRTLYDAWRANGKMVGAYFGHDHKNTFDGVDGNGIRLGVTKALTLHSYNDDDPGLRLFVVHSDGSFETEIGTEKHPFPAAADGTPYRPAPQPPPIASRAPDPIPQSAPAPAPQAAPAPAPQAAPAPAPQAAPAPAPQQAPSASNPAEQEGVRLWEDGPFWADRNVGAEEPWNPGLYFWWGDAVGYRRVGQAWVASDGSTTNFSFRHGGEAPYGKTADKLRSEGWTTEDGVLAPEHDSARAHWGGDWRMPTRQELLDIGYNRCDWIPTTTNGVKGYVVRGRGDYASASIFLPIDGWGDFTKLDRWEKYGHLWASDPRTDLPTSWRLRYGTGHNAVFYHFDRYVGTTVRPVRSGAARSFGQGTSAGRERREGETRIAGPACAPEGILVPASAGEPAAQEGVRLWEGGPLWADRNIGAETPSDYGWFFSWAGVVGHTHDPERRRWPAVDGSDPNHCCDESPRNAPGFGMDPDALRLDGVVTESGALAPERDAARAHWGAAWRMPTRRELDGLRDRCDWTWTTNGVKGCVVRGRGDYASAAIFLPAAGFGIEEKWWNKGETGLLWSSEPYAEGPPTDGSWRLHFGARGVGVNNCWDRYIAVPVRPVRDGADE